MPRVTQSRTENRVPPPTTLSQKQQNAILLNEMCNNVNQLHFYIMQQQQTIQQLQSILQTVCVAVFPGDAMKNIRAMYTDILTSSSSNLLNIPHFTNTPAAIISPETVPYYCDDSGSFPCSPIVNNTIIIDSDPSSPIPNKPPPPTPAAPVSKPLSKYKLKKLAAQMAAAAATNNNNSNNNSTIPALFNNQVTMNTNHDNVILNDDNLSADGNTDADNVCKQKQLVDNMFDLMSGWSPTATSTTASFRPVSNPDLNAIAVSNTEIDNDYPRPAKRKLVICSSDDSRNNYNAFRSISTV